MTGYNSETKRLARFGLLLCFTAFAFASDSVAQRIVTVEQGVGTLNEAIFGDTTSTGDRVDLNTIYELAPDGLYLLTGTIESRFPLHIRAGEGEGARPALVPAVGDGGGSSRPFTPRDDLTLEGLYVTGKDELGALKTRILRVRADSAHITIDNCHLDFDGQSGMRLDNEWNVIKVTNSVISNIGVVPDFANGRGIDTRGNPVDTVIFNNNTFYNITSRLIRDDGGLIKYARITRNTIYNVGRYGISLGGVQEAIVTDNLIMNAAFLGSSETVSYLVLDIDSLTSGDATAPQSLEISRNHFYSDPLVIAAYPDTVGHTPITDSLSPAYEVIMGDATNVIEDRAVAFVNVAALGSTGDVAVVPAAPSDVVSQYWVDETAGTAIEDRVSPPLDNGEGGPTNQDPFNFTYLDTEPAYTADAAGGPIGDRNWFDMVGVAVEESADVPETHRLVGNYPNPFNPSTTITFELASNADVSVEVFDVSGRKVMSVPVGATASGTVDVQINTLEAPSGTYVYRVQIDSGVDTKILTGTMTLLK